MKQQTYIKRKAQCAGNVKITYPGSSIFTS